jgi:hypothetical protein
MHFVGSDAYCCPKGHETPLESICQDVFNAIALLKVMTGFVFHDFFVLVNVNRSK